MYLIITVDTELSSHKGKIGIIGNIDGAEYGIQKIMEICDKYGVKATFFVDVYGYKKIGIDDMKAICKSIYEKGHDVQLHTHPDVYDKNRGYMALYNLDEQIEIISEGKKIFENYLGFSPVAHRAGDWGADYNTLKALEVNGIPLDCSMFYQWPLCGLNKPILTKNRCIRHNEILEIPATVFLSPSLGVFNQNRLFDLNANPLNELIYILNLIRNSNLKLAVLTLHSFSFLYWDKMRTNYCFNRAKIREFEKFLNYAAGETDIEILTIKKFYELYKHNPCVIDTQDYLPYSGYYFSLLRFFSYLLNLIKRRGCLSSAKTKEK